MKGSDYEGVVNLLSKVPKKIIKKGNAAWKREYYNLLARSYEHMGWGRYCQATGYPDGNADIKGYDYPSYHRYHSEAQTLLKTSEAWLWKAGSKGEIEFLWQKIRILCKRTKVERHAHTVWVGFQIPIRENQEQKRVRSKTVKLIREDVKNALYMLFESDNDQQAIMPLCDFLENGAPPNYQERNNHVDRIITCCSLSPNKMPGFIRGDGFLSVGERESNDLDILSSFWEYTSDTDLQNKYVKYLTDDHGIQWRFCGRFYGVTVDFHFALCDFLIEWASLYNDISYVIACGQCMIKYIEELYDFIWFYFFVNVYDPSERGKPLGELYAGLSRISALLLDFLHVLMDKKELFVINSEKYIQAKEFLYEIYNKILFECYYACHFLYEVILSGERRYLFPDFPLPKKQGGQFVMNGRCFFWGEVECFHKQMFDGFNVSSAAKSLSEAAFYIKIFDKHYDLVFQN